MLSYSIAFGYLRLGMIRKSNTVDDKQGDHEACHKRADQGDSG